MARKNYIMGKGYYYFNIKTGQQNITIKREEKQNALTSYQKYVSLGKKVEWLGKWNGKKFEENDIATVA